MVLVTVITIVNYDRHMFIVQATGLYHKHITVVNDAASVISK